MTHDLKKLASAIAHAVNYHSLDAQLRIPDYKIGELLAPEVAKHLDDTTDVQVIETMTREQRDAIGYGR